MTGKQTIFYWKLWSAAVRSQGWRMEKARLVRENERLGEQGLQVMAAAERLAQANHRAITFEDIRHAVHVVATGRNLSSKDLDNKAFNRVKTLLELLADPDNLDAVMDWQHPENADRRSTIAFIKKQAPEAYICEITRTKYQTIYWEDLDITSLRVLARELEHRKVEWHRYEAPRRHTTPAVLAAAEQSPEQIPY